MKLLIIKLTHVDFLRINRASEERHHEEDREKAPRPRFRLHGGES